MTDPAGEALAYLRSTATTDVNAAVDWMLDVGFDITKVRGGSDTSFGNVLVEFGVPGLRLMVTRDRGQWALDLYFGERHVAFHVALTAWRGDPAAVPSPDQQLEPQLPVGVVWVDALPPLIEWLAAADRTEALANAEQEWSLAFQRRMPRS